MKRQSIIYLLMFMFAFILPSFSFPNEKGSTEKNLQTTSDTVRIDVKFNNPNLTVTQVDVEKRLESYALNNKELITVVKEFSNNVTKLTKLQERRYESAMTQLERRTQFSIGQINKFITQKNTLFFILGLCWFIHLVLLITLYNTSYRRLKENMLSLIVVILGSATIFTLALLCWWPTFMGHDYQVFYALINISPI